MTQSPTPEPSKLSKLIRAFDRLDIELDSLFLLNLDPLDEEESSLTSSLEAELQELNHILASRPKPKQKLIIL